MNFGQELISGSGRPLALGTILWVGNVSHLSDRLESMLPIKNDFYFIFLHVYFGYVESDNLEQKVSWNWEFCKIICGS